MIPISEPDIRREDIDEVVSVLEEKQVSGRSPAVGRFEQEVRQTLFDGEKSIFAVCNGTAALILALRYYGLEPGEPVVLPAVTYAACANAIILAGGAPVFVDLSSSNSWCVYGEDLLVAARRTSARFVMVVHLYGETVDTRLLQHACLFPIEDCAEAVGNFYPMDSWDEAGVPKFCGTNERVISCFSLFANKTITSGEGGITAFPHLDSGSEIAVRQLYNNGTAGGGDFRPAVVGTNMRMSAMQAALGLSQLRRLENLKFARRGVTDFYRQELEKLEGSPFELMDEELCPEPWLFGVGLPTEGERDRLATQLTTGSGIETRLPFPVLPGCGPYKKYSGGREFPLAEDKVRRWLFLPSSPILKVRDQQRVLETLREFAEAGG